MYVTPPRKRCSFLLALLYPKSADTKSLATFYQVFRDEERESEDRNKARKALRGRVLREDESALTELYLYGSKLHTICSPLTEADQVAGFVLKMLSCITDQADETRLA